MFYFFNYEYQIINLFHLFLVKDAFDYQGRSFLHPPQDVGVNLRSDVAPLKCFLPKAHIHTWQGHTKGVSAIKWFPKSAHLLLSSSMDCRVKVCIKVEIFVRVFHRMDVIMPSLVFSFGKCTMNDVVFELIMVINKLSEIFASTTMALNFYQRVNFEKCFQNLYFSF